MHLAWLGSSSLNYVYDNQVPELDSLRSIDSESAAASILLNVVVAGDHVCTRRQELSKSDLRP
jgi:hypothetical protein